MEASFPARVSKDGKVVWSRPQDAADFFRAIAGQRVTITITPGRRTLSQNALLHAICKEFSRLSGYTPAQAKEYLKARFIDDGRGTADMDIEECREFTSWAQAWIAEHL